MEEFAILVGDRRTQQVADRRRVDAECAAKQRLGKRPIAVLGQMNSIDCQIGAGAAHGLMGVVKHVDKADLLLFRNLPHDIDVQLNAIVVHVGGGDVFDIFVGDRRNQYNSRSAAAVERFRLQTRQVIAQFAAEGHKPLFTGKRFVESKGGENDIRPLVRQMLFGIGEVGRTRLQCNLVGRPGQMPDDQLVSRELLMQHRLEIAELGRSFERGIPDQRNPIALAQLQRQNGGDGRAGIGPRSGFLVNAELMEFLGDDGAG